MIVQFKKKYKSPNGRIFKKGIEEGLTRDVALPLIKDGYCEEIVPEKELVPTGLVDKKGEQILKEK